MRRKVLILLLACNVLCAGCSKEVDNSKDLKVEVPRTQISVEEVEEVAEEESEVTLVMVGDILLHDRVEKSAKQEDGTYNFDALFANVKEEIEAADLALVNQEVIIGGSELGISGYPAFNAPYEIGDALVRNGFDVILHATNHALDKGKKGLTNCISFWEENYPDIDFIGINKSAEAADDILVKEINGIKIAILDYTYGTNGIDLPSDMPFAVNLLDKEKAAKDIAKAREQADFIIVCPHWGTEYQLEASRYQVEYNEFFLENGVDLVLGTHPHVIEPIEMYEDEDFDRKMLTYYSLGNFVNWTSGTGEGVSNRMVGGMAQVTIAKDEAGDAYIKDYGVEPLICHVEQGTNNVTVYPIEMYSEDMAASNEIKSQAPDFSYEYCVELCDKVWGEIWK